MKCSGQSDQNGGAVCECAGQAMQQMRQPKQWARVDDNEYEQRAIYIVLCDELQRHPKQLFNCRSYDMILKQGSDWLKYSRGNHSVAGIFVEHIIAKMVTAGGEIV